MDYFLYYIITINFVGLSIMYADKRRARNNQYRISEKSLWTVAFLGGAIGATIGMQWFRHKTKHLSFKLGLPVLSIIEMGIGFYAILS